MNPLMVLISLCLRKFHRRRLHVAVVRPRAKDCGTPSGVAILPMRKRHSDTPNIPYEPTPFAGRKADEKAQQRTCSTQPNAAAAHPPRRRNRGLENKHTPQDQVQALPHTPPETLPEPMLPLAERRRSRTQSPAEIVTGDNTYANIRRPMSEDVHTTDGQARDARYCEQAPGITGPKPSSHREDHSEKRPP